MTPSSIGTKQPSVPQYLLGIEYNNVYGTGYLGWMNPSNYTGTPCNNPLLTLHTTVPTQLVKITGTVTDSDGNPVADSGGICAGLYSVYFSITPESANQSFNTGAGTAYWDYDYAIMDANGNVLTSISPDASGNFTVYLGITPVNYSFIAAFLSGGSCINPTTPLPYTATVYFGFNSNPSSTLNAGVQVVEWDISIIAKIVG